MDDEHSSITLKAISQALGMPIEAFFKQGKSCFLNAEQRYKIDLAELFEAFERITDPEVRRRCIEFVRAASKA